MPVQVPFVSDPPVYSFATTLDGTVFLFDVRWNARDEAWYFDIYAEDETPIKYGQKIVLGNLLARTSDPNRPQGYLIAIDTSNQGEEAGLEDLGDRVQVQFWTWAEMAALG